MDRGGRGAARRLAARGPDGGDARGADRRAAAGLRRASIARMRARRAIWSMSGADSPVHLAETAALLAGAREVGGMLVVHAPVGEADALGMEAIAAAPAPSACRCWSARWARPRERRIAAGLAEAGVPVFATPGQAVRGFLHLVQDRRNRAAARELPPSAVLRIAPDQDWWLRPSPAPAPKGG